MHPAIFFYRRWAETHYGIEKSIGYLFYISGDFKIS